MKEETGEKILTKKEEVKLILDEIEKEAFEIYKKVMDDIKLPEYYLYELLQKNEYLRSRLYSVLNLINLVLDDEVNKDFYNRTKVFITSVINALLLIIVPSVGIITSGIYSFYLLNKLSKTKNEELTKLEEELRALIDRINSVVINIDNNEVFLKKKVKELTKERIEEVSHDKEKVNRILEANILIQDYLNYGKLPKSAKEDVKEVAVNMLRQDLNSNETDLETLLNLAKKQISLDTLVRRMEFDEK